MPESSKKGLAIETHPMLKALQQGYEPEAPKSPPKSTARTVQEQKPAKKDDEPKKATFDPNKNPYFNPKARGPKSRMPRTFKFVEHGKYIEQANKMRSEASLYFLFNVIGQIGKVKGSDCCCSQENWHGGRIGIGI